MPNSPRKITRDHVLRAARIWKKDHGHGGFRDSVRYDVVINRERFPPKAIAAIANGLAGNGDLLPSEFAGARDGKWHRLLEDLDFEIVPKEKGSPVDEQDGSPTKLDADWTKSELRASVAAYLDMARRIRVGQPVVKKQVYRDLAAQIDRTEKSCEYRMQNISYVLALMGRDWIKGLPPAKNVGARVAGQIEALIGELEGRQESPRAADAVVVAKIRKTLKQRPAGSKTPKKITSTTTSVVRDPQVKAWVLERANGTCEACDQPAPFIGADGFPFLEVHHLRKLADDGSDTVTNAVAVCPNCHRRLHFSENAHSYRDTLYGKVAELVRE
ncbi:HNH endonuclease [Burkholderia multivorans]|uniref:HNH endonuclease n=1 Tax=Burkholderia multivorans TaxID=87883 RepID=UPI0020B2DDA0|nr:HNH endonuclease signature motif containing protein [Burkholderia multivorans]